METSLKAAMLPLPKTATAVAKTSHAAGQRQPTAPAAADMSVSTANAKPMPVPAGDAAATRLLMRAQQSLVALENLRMAVSIRSDSAVDVSMSEIIRESMEIRELRVQTGNGDDIVSVRLKNLPPSDRARTEEIVIQTNGGDDVVELKQPDNPVHGDGIFSGRYNIDVGSGDDNVSIDYRGIFNEVHLGDGDDNLEVGGGGQVFADGGDGDDRILVKEGTSGNVTAGAGDDVVVAEDAAIQRVDGGAGDDVISVHAASMDVRGGAGDDDVTVTASTEHDVWSLERTPDGGFVVRSTEQEGVAWLDYGFDQGDGNDTVSLGGDRPVDATVTVGAGLTAADTVVERHGDTVMVRFGSGDSITFNHVEGHRIQLKFDNGVTVLANPFAESAEAVVAADRAVDLSA